MISIINNDNNNTINLIDNQQKKERIDVIKVDNVEHNGDKSISKVFKKEDEYENDVDEDDGDVDDNEFEDVDDEYDDDDDEFYFLLAAPINNRIHHGKQNSFSKVFYCKTARNNKFYLKNIKEDDKDSLVDTSADSEDDDEHHLMSNRIKSESNGSTIKLSSYCNKKKSSLSLSSALHSNKKSKKNRKNCDNLKLNTVDNKKLCSDLEQPESPPASKSPNCFCCFSDVIESDHYTTDSTNSSNDNLTFSPLPPLALSLTTLNLDCKISFTTSYLLNSQISSISSKSLVDDNHLNVCQKVDITPTNINSSFLPQYGHPSSTLALIRNAVSHLTRLDDFNVVKLSQGFFSQVFKVTHLPTSKIMVLKMNKNPGNRGNALKEIELLNKLNHPNIVAYMGTVVHEGALHPLLEYINGGTLEQLIHKYYPQELKDPQKNNCYVMMVDGHNQSITGKIKEQEGYFISSPKVHRLNNPDGTFIKLMADVCRGMAYLHSQGYLHRDLASKNIFIRKRLNNDNNMTTVKFYQQNLKYQRSPSENGDQINLFDDYRLEAVIGDFGFAIPEPSCDQKLSIVGSPYWLAPECLKNKWYNHKCDIFSFGVICCELNWRMPSDPDYLPRCDNYAIDFLKLVHKKDTLLARIAVLACQYEPEKRPEFYELLKIFDKEINKNYRPKNVLPTSISKVSFKRVNSLDPNVLSNESVKNNIQPVIDVFEQHLQRRRHLALINYQNFVALNELDVNNSCNNR